MADICSNTIRIYGEKELVKKFFGDITRELTAKEISEFEREYSKSIQDTDLNWLGFLYMKVGYSLTEVSNTTHFNLRSSVDLIELSDDNDYVTMYIQSAWSPIFDDINVVLAEKYSGLYSVGIFEEPGNCIFINTDATGLIFPEKYIVDDSEDVYYFTKDESQDFVNLINKLTKSHYETVYDIFNNKLKICKKYYDMHGEYLLIEEFMLKF